MMIKSSIAKAIPGDGDETKTNIDDTTKLILAVLVGSDALGNYIYLTIFNTL